MAGKAQQRAPHGGKIINTGHGLVELEVFETGMPPRFRLHAYDSSVERELFHDHDSVSIETLRPDGIKQTFALKASGNYLESSQEIPEPHEFKTV